MSPEEKLAHLLESVFIPTDRPVTISDIESVLDDLSFARVRMTLDAATVPVIPDGASEVEVLMARMIAKKMEDAVHAMRGSGLLISSPERQGMIDQLAAAGQWPDAVRDAVKTLGGIWKPRWQVEGHETEPTLESVTAEIAAEELAEANRILAETKQTLVSTTRTAINSRTTAINAWLDTIDLTKSVAEIEDYIADLLSSPDGNPTQGGE